MLSKDYTIIVLGDDNMDENRICLCNLTKEEIDFVIKNKPNKETAIYVTDSLTDIVAHSCF